MSELYLANHDILIENERSSVHNDKQKERIVIIREYPFLKKSKIIKLFLTFDEAEQLEGQLSEALNNYVEKK